MSLASGLVGQLEVVNALILRETRTRFGSHQLGYLWAFIEPVLWIITFWALFFIAKRTPPHGMDLLLFLVTGIVPYDLFRETVSRSMSAISANKALLFYPQVRPLDLVLARSTLEVATNATVFVALIAGVALINGGFSCENLLLVLLGLCLAGLFGATLGLMLCAASVFAGVVERLVGPILRPLFWISGIFFTANDLPSNIRQYMMWNPVLHCVELVRDGWFTSYTAWHASPAYVAAWILALGFAGLTLERVARNRLELT